ncbi:hypothetical protein E2320_008324 [Naja naja]|nr:hypothetical protein E2320_008324 [Naja naja]
MKPAALCNVPGLAASATWPPSRLCPHSHGRVIYQGWRRGRSEDRAAVTPPRGEQTKTIVY